MADNANNAANVTVGRPKASGGIRMADLGVVVPASVDAALDPTFVNCGYVSADGVTLSPSDDSNDIVAWGGVIVRVVKTGSSWTVQLAFLETNIQVQKIYYGDTNVTFEAPDGTHGSLTTVRLTSDELPHKVLVVEIIDGKRTGRIVLPDVQVSDRGELVFVHEDAVTYDVTFRVFETVVGGVAVFGFIYWDDGIVTPIEVPETP